MLINEVIAVDSCSGPDELCAHHFKTIKIKANQDSPYPLQTTMSGSHSAGISSKGEWSQEGSLWTFAGERIESVNGYSVVEAAWDAITGLFSVSRHAEAYEGSASAEVWQRNIGAREYTTQFTGYTSVAAGGSQPEPVQVPEPDIMALMVIGFVAVAISRRFKKKRG